MYLYSQIRRKVALNYGKSCIFKSRIWPLNSRSSQQRYIYIYGIGTLLRIYVILKTNTEHREHLLTVKQQYNERAQFYDYFTVAHTNISFIVAEYRGGFLGARMSLYRRRRAFNSHVLQRFYERKFSRSSFLRVNQTTCYVRCFSSVYSSNKCFTSCAR